jgi:hypothetical protein
LPSAGAVVCGTAVALSSLLPVIVLVIVAIVNVIDHAPLISFVLFLSVLPHTFKSILDIYCVSDNVF